MASYTLTLSPDEEVLTVYRGRADRLEVRGMFDYARVHIPTDPLHRALDEMDPATVSVLFTFERITLNPKNPRQDPTRALCDRLFAEVDARGASQ